MSDWTQRCQRLLDATVLGFALALCFPITVTWISLIVGLVAWAGAIACRIATKQPVFVKPPLLYPLVSFALVNAVVGAVHGGIGEAWGSLLTLRPMICYFWAFDAFARNQRLQAIATAVLLSLSAVAGVFGLIQLGCHCHPFTVPYEQGTGFCMHPMEFAGQMELFVLLSIGLCLRKGYRWLPGPYAKLPLFAAITVCNVLGLIAADERSAWLGFGVGLVLMAILVSRKLAAGLVIALPVLAAGACFTVPVFRNRLEPLLHLETDPSTQARFTMWTTAWQEFLKNPIFGCGVRNFPRVHTDFQAVELHGESFLAHGHSNYLHILATTGIVGFTIFIWLLFASVRLAWQQAQVQRIRDVLTGRALAFKRSVGLGMFGALISLAVAGIFEYNFGTGQVRLAEWFLLAMLVPIQVPLQALAKPVPEKAARSRPERKRKAA